MRREPAGTKVVALLIVLSAAVGLGLLLLGRAPTPWENAGGTSPTPSPSPTNTPLPTLPPPTPAPGPLLHTVQPGETLASIAALYGVPLADLIAVNKIPDPNLIRVGQVLVIPGRWVTPTPAPPAPTAGPVGAVGPSPTPIPRPILPTLTPAGPPMVEIAGVLGAGDLAREVVRIRNRGGMVSLEGWTLSNAAGNRYVFPRLILFPGGEVVLHSGSGASNPTHLYWNRPAPAWQSGELLTLRDREGGVVDTYVVP